MGVKPTNAVRVSVEITGDVANPAALIAIARAQYTAFATAIDVEGMTEEEELAVADLPAKEMRAHPRYVTPEQAVYDVADAALVIIEKALAEAGVALDSASTRLLTRTDDFERERAAPWRQGRLRRHRAGAARRSPKRRKER